MGVNSVNCEIIVICDIFHYFPHKSLFKSVVKEDVSLSDSHIAAGP